MEVLTVITEKKPEYAVDLTIPIILFSPHKAFILKELQRIIAKVLLIVHPGDALNLRVRFSLTMDIGRCIIPINISYAEYLPFGMGIRNLAYSKYADNTPVFEERRNFFSYFQVVTKSAILTTAPPRSILR